jgi:hypothetical protein
VDSPASASGYFLPRVAEPQAPELQAPNPRQTPSTKARTSTKLQAPNLKQTPEKQAPNSKH